MFNIYPKSIRDKILIGITLAVLSSIIMVGIVAYTQTRSIIIHRLIDVELPLTLHKISGEIDQEIAKLLTAAEQLANNEFVINAISNENISSDTEITLTEQLNNIQLQYQLNDASIINRHTAYYWDQNGFLRELNKSQDSWFFSRVLSDEKTKVSVFQEKNGDIKIFANYQQPNGTSMSGLSKSMGYMIELLDKFKLEKTGFVFLTDSLGNIKIHQEKDANSHSTLNSLYGSKSSLLLNRNSFNIISTEEEGVDKFIISTYISSMDWFIIGVVPIDEVFTELNTMATKMLIVTISIALLFIVMGIFISNSITKPIKILSERFCNLDDGDGDISQRIEVRGDREIAQLSQGFNRFMDKIHRSIKEVSSTSYALQNTADIVHHKSDITHGNSQEQCNQTIQVVAAINEMGTTISEIASNAATAAETASQAEDNTETGLHVVNQTKITINRLAKDIQDTSQVVEQLAATTQSIGSILDVIRDISDQTNLLALNAAIEAARAGEQGRGFAVVADEVRNLASRTADSTDEIQQMIDKLQNDAGDAVAAMEAGRVLTSEGVASANEAVEVLANIADRIHEISDRNTQVATATEEQSTVVHTINKNIEEINVINEVTTSTAKELASASQELSNLSHRLDSMVGSFKL